MIVTAHGQCSLGNLTISGTTVMFLITDVYAGTKSETIRLYEDLMSGVRVFRIWTNAPDI